MTVIFSGANEGPATGTHRRDRRRERSPSSTSWRRSGPGPRWPPGGRGEGGAGGDHGSKRDHDPAGSAPGTITPWIGRHTIAVGETASGTRGGEKWPDGEIHRRRNRTAQMASRNAFVKRFPKHSAIERFVCCRSHSPETTIKLEERTRTHFFTFKNYGRHTCVSKMRSNLSFRKI